MTPYEHVMKELKDNPRTWLITGVAGFIGSNLLETLLKLDQVVIGLDNFATGRKCNLEEVRKSVDKGQWEDFKFREGDIRDINDCRRACEGVDYVLHQAALGSVPRSINDPLLTNAANVDGFLNMLVAARDARVKSFTYAASSSTYGDHPGLPKVEEVIGKPLSPYAVTKYVNELYAEVFAKVYGFNSIGLRYFNVYGKRQDPEGAYAAVIPRWVKSMIDGEDIFINGDGSTSRDFCYIENTVQANILAATTFSEEASGEVYNVAMGERTSLNELFRLIKDSLAVIGIRYDKHPIYREFRAGDVLHSQADIEKIKLKLGYTGKVKVKEGVPLSISWYAANATHAK